MSKIIIITGGSSGIGLCTAKALAKQGHTVYEFSRRESNHGDIYHLTADVTDEAAVQKAVEEVAAAHGRIDVLINNAGFGISGAVEFTKAEDAKRLFDVDFFGTVNATKAVLPYMRKQGAGRIVNISSVAAPVAIPFQTYYSAAKAAINSYTLALSNEVRPFGIEVCAVMPGDIQTGFTSARDKSNDGDEIYGGRISRSVSVMEKDEQNGMSPEKAAGFIARVATKKSVKPLYTLGFSYKCVVLLTKVLPVSVVNRVVSMIYAK